MSKATDINLWGSHVLTCFRQPPVAPAWTHGAAVVQ
jgi:hypothetical protein